MANVLTPYDPLFLAQKALKRLTLVLGMANRVNRQYDEERKIFRKGSIVQVRRPGAVSAIAGGTGTAQAMLPESVNIILDQYWEVPLELTDQQEAYTGTAPIDEHINSAVYALAYKIDTHLTSLYKKMPWSYDEGTFGSAGLLAARKILRDNAGPAIDEPGMVHMACDSTLETALLGLDIFQDASVQGVTTNTTLLTGTLGTRYNINFFVNTNLGSHTGGTVTTGADQAGALTANVLKGATSIAVGSFVDGETLVAGDSLVIAGNSQRYSVTADVTLTGGAGTIGIFPAAVQAYTSGDVVTAEDDGASVHAGSYYPDILYHRDAIGLVFAPLPERNELGVQMATVTDPMTGISLRVRRAYDNTPARVVTTIDAMWGAEILDPNLALIYRRNKA